MGCRTELQDIQTVRPANKRGLQASTVANVGMDESSREVEVVDIVQVLEAAAGHETQRDGEVLPFRHWLQQN